MAKNPKRPRDPNMLAKMIVDMSTGADLPQETAPAGPEKNAAAVALGRLGGLKGGKARADSLTPEKRSDIAKAAAAKRWEAK
ncbi:MAG: histone [Verrucomicrobiaceae bacterium]|nr:histone [Verrucomicrobiaceae bacterium]